MIVSNEPGFYLTGEYGIRIENLIFVKESAKYTGFLEFEELTLAPIDRQLIEPALLDDAELDWLNRYHQKVRDTLMPLVNEKTQAWLQAATQPIQRR
ncbi:M24 family metallopeptidase C-terminal domain-containing protein [Microbulbifer sp. ALW1]|uniref:M24 family metallopeptidase C-terminal domain-containing protein n=1 Tax=Microbulbifer sp. (strain ALW1) TaxID=1516059 RepID=UPI003519F123